MRKQRRFALWRALPLLAALAVVGAACSSDEGSVASTRDPDTAPVSDDGTKTVVVDYSPTQSDVGALLYVLSQPDVSVAAITMPGTGEAHCEHAVPTTLGILAALGRQEIPVACGQDAPLSGDNAFPEAWRQTADEMEGLDVARVERADAGDAVDLLYDTISGADRPVTVLTLGPLTNLGRAVEAHPELVENLDHIYVMGGAVNVAGNVLDGGTAEWNIWVDPRAANLVLRSGVPITLVPLDATNDVPVDANIYRALFVEGAALPLEIMRSIAGASPEWYSGGFYLWDELAAGVMVHNAYADFETMRLEVDESGETVGRTRIDPAGSEVRVAVSADRVRFTNDLVSTWAGFDIAVFEAVSPEMAAYAAQLERAADTYRRAQDAVFAAALNDYPDFEFDAETPLETTRGFFLTVLPRFVAATEEYLSDLNAITVPTGLEEHAVYVAALEAQLELSRELETHLEAITSTQELQAFLDDGRFEEVAVLCRDLQEALGSYALVVELSC